MFHKSWTIYRKRQSDKSAYEATLSQKDYIIAFLESAFLKAIDLLDTVCRKALKAVIDFSQKPIARQFTFEQACAVNEFLDTDTDRQHAINTLSVPSLSHRKRTRQRGTGDAECSQQLFRVWKGWKGKVKMDIRLSRGLKTWKEKVSSFSREKNCY